MNDEDSALTESLDALFARNDARPLPGTGRGKTGPAASLRARCKDAIRPLADLGSRPLWEPRLTAGQVRVGGSKHAISVGNKGQTDVLVTWFGHAFHVELKAGRDRQRESQARYAPFIHRAHGSRLEVREPGDLVAAMMDWFNTHPQTVQEVTGIAPLRRGQ